MQVGDWQCQGLNLYQTEDAEIAFCLRFYPASRMGGFQNLLETPMAL